MIYFLTCSIIWGLTWIAIKFQFGAVDSNVAVFYRFAISSLIMLTLCLFKKENLQFKKADHIRFFGQGFFMFCLNYLLTYWASHLAPSALVALAFTCLIYFNMFGAKLFLKSPFEKKVIYGASLSFLGMGFISYNEILHIKEHPYYILGFLISLIATLSASCGNLISSQNRKNNISILANNTWGMFYGASLCLIYCLILNKNFSVEFNINFVFSFLYLTVFGTVISFAAYLKLIDLVGPSKAAFTSVISPLIAVGLSFYYENMQISKFFLVGLIFCLLGNIVALAPNKYYLILLNLVSSLFNFISSHVFKSNSKVTK